MGVRDDDDVDVLGRDPLLAERGGQVPRRSAERLRVLAEARVDEGDPTVGAKEQAVVGGPQPPLVASRPASSGASSDRSTFANGKLGSTRRAPSLTTAQSIAPIRTQPFSRARVGTASAEATALRSVARFFPLVCSIVRRWSDPAGWPRSNRVCIAKEAATRLSAIGQGRALKKVRRPFAEHAARKSTLVSTSPRNGLQRRATPSSSPHPSRGAARLPQTGKPPCARGFAGGPPEELPSGNDEWKR